MVNVVAINDPFIDPKVCLITSYAEPLVMYVYAVALYHAGQFTLHLQSIRYCLSCICILCSTDCTVLFVSMYVYTNTYFIYTM
jgi:hypothetical protein